jgi:phosphate transport system protein
MGRMAEVAEDMVRRVRGIIIDRDVEAAVDIALLGRYYERIADHSVSVANRVVFVVTGERPERD